MAPVCPPLHHGALKWATWRPSPLARSETPVMARKASKTKAAGFGIEGPPGQISKSEAVRRSLADGVDQPADGVAYIKGPSKNKFQAGPLLLSVP